MTRASLLPKKAISEPCPSIAGPVNISSFVLNQFDPSKMFATVVRRPAYSPRFSADDFGVVVRCREQDVAEIDALLRKNDATEVTLVES